jgi:hypothetical protein
MTSQLHFDTTQRMSDLGPRYAETDPAHFPVDAWATWTNLVFLVAVVYWTRRLRGQARRRRMLAFTLPLLLVGWIGGTIYHATRSHVCWTLLDWYPIAIPVLAAAGWPHGSHYLWHIFGGLATFFTFDVLYALRAGDCAETPGKTFHRSGKAMPL